MFTVYLDGYPICTFDTEAEAELWCVMYDGDKTPSYMTKSFKKMHAKGYQTSRVLIQ